MRKIIHLLMLCGLMACQTAPKNALPDLTPPASPYPINTMLGTTGAHPTEYGGLTPAVGVPFGKTQWSPVTQLNQISKTTYKHEHTQFMGIQATHQPAVWMGDYGYFRFFPKIAGDTNQSYPYLKQSQISTPAFYQVKYGTPTDSLQITTTGNAHANITVIVPQTQHDSIELFIEISRLKGFLGTYSAQPKQGILLATNADWHSSACGGGLDKAFKGYLYLNTGQPYTIVNGPNQGQAETLGLTIKLKKADYITLKIGTSFISHKMAQNHANISLNNKTLKQLATQVQQAHDSILSRVTLKNGGIINDTVFYTALYRCFQYPRNITEKKQYRSPFDGKVHFGTFYTDFSLWDTFRALHPLQILITPERVNEMIGALVAMYEQTGWMPKWPNPAFTNIMIGTHADAVVADAYIKGFKSYEVIKAYRGILKNALTPPDGDVGNPWADRQNPFKAYEARGGLTYYQKMGYVPADSVREAVSRTVEFSIGDYCIAQMAKKLGQHDDYKLLMKRSRNFKNLYNAKTGFLEPRLANGSFAQTDMGFTEGSKWTYRFGAMHLPFEMIEMLGGKQKFLAALDSNFSQGHYRHDNEPGHHFPFLYTLAGQPKKCHQIVAEQALKHYKNTPDGLSGNDDCGQMSAWYVFAAMGFYPVEPASGRYVISGPLANEIIINPTGKPKDKIVIKPTNQNNNGLIINQTTYKPPFVTHAQLTNQPQ